MKSRRNLPIRDRACPVCDGIRCQNLHDMQFVLPVGSPLPSSYSVVACADCGLVYADTPGRTEDYDRYYAEFSHYEDPSATGGGEQAFDKRRISEVAAWIASHVRTDARVLDIGCGNGGILLALREQGFLRLTGLDPSQACVMRLKEAGIEAFHGWLGGNLSVLGKFDLIILSHVLEHLLEPRSALSALKELLTDTGNIYIETPDAARYVDYPIIPYYYFDSEHINHFDRFSLDNLAKAGGFHVKNSASKTLTLLDDQAYPAIFALLSIAAAPESIRPDTSAKKAILDYVKQSANATGLPDILLKAIVDGRPIALWGAGSQAQKLLLEGVMPKAQIIAVVDGDRNKHGMSFAGCTVTSPARGLARLPNNCLVVIAAALVAEQIRVEYRALGFPYECIVN